MKKKNFRMKRTFLGLITTFLLTPIFVFALTFEDIVNRILDLIQTIIPMLVALAIVGLFFGIAKYIFSAGNPEKRAEGAKFMIFGIVALFVMVSVWGLVAILQHTIFGSDPESLSGFSGIPAL